ncbi:MAG TPA: beta-1,3-glucanase family protein [Chthoniobacteraceae bacterium]|nr:beta-1,3-glucanase family protein [Chthoniobacteraceae bacterium]
MQSLLPIARHPARGLLKKSLAVAAIACAGFASTSQAQQASPAPSPSPAAAANDDFYQFVNATGGAFTDAQAAWSMDGGNTWHSFSEAKSAPARMGNGRLYFKLQNDKGTWQDFMEYAQDKNAWHGNTTYVDALVIPLTIELVRADGSEIKLGMDQSRKGMFDMFKKDAPKEFLSCVVGDERIASPNQVDFAEGKPFANYFDKYVDEIWDMYAQPKTLPSGWTGQVVDGALKFTKPGQKDWVLKKKPTTQEILLGAGELSSSPGFCAAFNRHIAADPGDWRDPSKFYQQLPYNYYSKFMHEHTVDGRAYGFCYDDMAEQASFASAKAVKLVVTLYWDAVPPAKEAKAREMAYPDKK